MTRNMLINGREPEELRVAIIDEGKLESYQVEIAEAGLKRGNIYRGVVANIQPSLDAAFIDFGDDKHGFLTGHDVVRQAYHHLPDKEEKRPRIDQLLKKGKTILVQVTRDAVENKGATLTTNLSVPGRYLVMMPFDESRGLSRKIEDEELRKQLRERAASLTLPDGYGYIVRTNAADQTKTALKTDVSGLLRLCRNILAEGKKGSGPRLLYDDQDLVVQALRDYLDGSIEQVLVDDEQLYQRAEDYVRATMPRSKLDVSYYDGRVPLFSRYNIEPQIESVYQRVVRLPSGGSIVIDHAEALTAIDVNSGKDTRGASQEETAFKTNMAAVEEVARQLRLRDIGGLLVVDLIDMRQRKHRSAVEKALRQAMKPDKARHSVGRISANGLLEINRQRIKQALGQRMHRGCPTCQGSGRLATPELIGLRLLRRIEARAATGRLRTVRVALHPELADALQNQRRQQLAALETKFGIAVEVVAAAHLHRADEQIEWVNREKDASPEWGSSRDDSRRRNPALGARDTVEGRLPELATKAATPEDSATSAAPEGDETAPSSANDEGRRRRRRRGGRRRRGARGTDTSSAADTNGEASSESSATGADEKAADATSEAAAPLSTSDATTGTAPARSKRRRRRRQPSDANGAEPGAAASKDETPPASDPIATASGEAPTASDEEREVASDESTKKPATRRPARRRSRRRTTPTTESA